MNGIDQFLKLNSIFETNYSIFEEMEKSLRYFIPFGTQGSICYYEPMSREIDTLDKQIGRIQSKNIPHVFLPSRTTSNHYIQAVKAKIDKKGIDSTILDFSNVFGSHPKISSLLSDTNIIELPREKLVYLENIRLAEQILDTVRSFDFYILFPESDYQIFSLFLSRSILYLDNSITQDDIAFYLSIKKENKVFQKSLLSFKNFLESEYYVLKQIESNSINFIQARRKQEALLEESNEKIVYIQNEAPLALNLNSLYEKDSKHSGIEKIPIHFNLDSLHDTEGKDKPGKKDSKEEIEKDSSVIKDNEEIESEELFDLDEDIPDLIDSNILPIANIDALIDKELINIKENHEDSQSSEDISNSENNKTKESNQNGRTGSDSSLEQLEPEIVLTDENGVPFPAVVDLDTLIIDELESETMDDLDENSLLKAEEEKESQTNEENNLNLEDPNTYSAAINLDNLLTDELEPEAINLDETNFLENSLPNIETLINEEVELGLKKSIEELDKSSSMLEPIPEDENDSDEKAKE